MQHKATSWIENDHQIIQLPKAFRLEAEEIFVSVDPSTGNVILSQHKSTQNTQNTWAEFFEFIRKNPAPDDFMEDREKVYEEDKDVFADAQRANLSPAQQKRAEWDELIALIQQQPAPDNFLQRDLRPVEDKVLF